VESTQADRRWRAAGTGGVARAFLTCESDGQPECIVFGKTSYGMLWLWFIGAAVLGFALAYGILRVSRLRRGERERLDRNTKATQRADDPQKRPF
jgi:hypothetical protein